MITHDLGVIAGIADRVAVMYMPVVLLSRVMSTMASSTIRRCRTPLAFWDRFHVWMNARKRHWLRWKRPPSMLVEHRLSFCGALPDCQG